MQIVSRSQYDADPQGATGPTIPMSALGAGGKLDDSFKNLLPKYTPKDDYSIPPVDDSIILKFTPAEAQALEAKWEAMHTPGSSLERQHHCGPNPLKLYGDSRDSALIPRVFGPHESESMKIAIANAKRTGFGLIPPECMRYVYHFQLPQWYTDVLNAPLNAREQQEDDQNSSVAMDEEQAQALTAEYHQAVGQSLSRALDNLGIRENDFDGNYKALQSPKLREEFSRIMNSDPRTKEVMSLLGVKV
jgi:hypothetical protein